MTWSIDGVTSTQNITGVNNVSFSLTTSNSNDVILICLTTGSTTLNVSNISDVAGLVWAKRGAIIGTNNTTYIYWASSLNPLSSDTITISFTQKVDVSIDALGVSGSPNYTSPWDTNTSLPSYSNGSTNTPNAVLSTNSSNDFVLAILGGNDNPNPTTPNGFTEIGTQQNTPALNVSYNVYSGPLLNIRIGWTIGNGHTWETILDALSGTPSGSTGTGTLPSTATSIVQYVSPPPSSVWHLSGFTTQFQNLTSGVITVSQLQAGVVIGGNYPIQMALPLSNAGVLLSGSQITSIVLPSSGILQAIGGTSQQPYYEPAGVNILYLPWNAQIDVTNNDLIEINASFLPSGATPTNLFWAFLGYQEPL
ncbi:MAG: hypothetical protein WA549_00155 [Thermoplasmata archaeon]